MNALMVAVWHQQERAVKSLLTRGVDVNHQDKDGDAAVHGASLYGNGSCSGCCSMEARIRTSRTRWEGRR